MSKPTPHVAALAVSFHIPASQSLKEKRRVLKSIKDRIRNRFNVSVSEIGDLDKWQASVIGVCVIGTDKGHLSGNLEAVLALFNGVSEINVTDSQMEFLV